jgi:hypothetical protein
MFSLVRFRGISVNEVLELKGKKGTKNGTTYEGDEHYEETELTVAFLVQNRFRKP